MPVFIRRSAPGDRLRVRIARDHRSWAEGEILEITEASPRRISPPCPYYARCGGCSLQHLDYTSQLEAKKNILRESFTRIAGVVPGEIPVYPSPAWEYRNRVQLHRAGAGALGFKAAISNTVVPVKDCPVADPGIRALLAAGELEAPAGKDRFSLYSRGKLLLREGDRGSRGLVRIHDRELILDAGLFFQSNAVMLETLIGDLLEIAEKADSSLPLADLYCGVGTFAAFLQDQFSPIDFLEENRTALSLARENVRGKQHGYFAITDNEWVEMKKNQNAGGRGYGLIIADPPRQGLSPAMRSYLAKGPAETFVYVSCDPATLARDSKELLTGAWKLEKLGLYDFYPQTAHIESLALFRNSHVRAA
jgi:23S rRNA (uracil1939-C5)-methyltransferase